MVIQSSSDLVSAVRADVLASGQDVTVADLVNGCQLVVADDGIALYRQGANLADPLGNGLIRLAPFPDDIRLPESQSCITDHRAGYVGLAGGFVLLIGLNDVRLFANKMDALRNQQERLRMSLEY